MRNRIIWSVPVTAFFLLLVFLPACSKNNGDAKPADQKAADQFTQLMTRGNGFFEKGDATNAIAAYQEAVKLAPERLDARLNLANDEQPAQLF